MGGEDEQEEDHSHGAVGSSDRGVVVLIVIHAVASDGATMHIAIVELANGDGLAEEASGQQELNEDETSDVASVVGLSSAAELVLSCFLLCLDLAVAEDQEEEGKSGNGELNDQEEGVGLVEAFWPVGRVVVVAIVIQKSAIVDLDLKNHHVNTAEGIETDDENGQDSSADAGLGVNGFRFEVLDHDISVVN